MTRTRPRTPRTPWMPALRVLRLLEARGADPSIFASETIMFWLKRGKTPAEVVAILLGTP